MIGGGSGARAPAELRSSARRAVRVCALASFADRGNPLWVWPRERRTTVALFLTRQHRLRATFSQPYEYLSVAEIHPVGVKAADTPPDVCRQGLGQGNLPRRGSPHDRRGARLASPTIRYTVLAERRPRAAAGIARGGQEGLRFPALEFISAHDSRSFSQTQLQISLKYQPRAELGSKCSIRALLWRQSIHFADGSPTTLSAVQGTEAKERTSTPRMASAAQARLGRLPGRPVVRSPPDWTTAPGQLAAPA